MATDSEMLLKMCKVEEPQGTDEELVREALRRYRLFMAVHQFGLLAYQYKLSRVALEAFERLVDPRQMLWAEEE